MAFKNYPNDGRKDENLRRSDGLKALLARSIPDLCLDRAACFQRDALGCKLHTDGRVLILWQLILNISAQ